MQASGKAAILFVLLMTCLSLAAFAPQAEPKAKLDRREARNAFELLNKIRENPAPYARELKMPGNLKISNGPLVWNKVLARAAEAKALDMANEQYFAHVDKQGYGMNYHIHQEGYRLIPEFLRKRSDNTFESIAAGPESGEAAIRMLIIDDNTPGKGHRDHLLGINKWNRSLVDIGIGFVHCESGCRFKSYVSVIIAKHDW